MIEYEEDPERPGSLVPEYRWTTPVIYMRRTAKKDAELNGAQIKAGDKVVMYFGSANRDPAHFEAPDALDLARPIESHLAFGAGPHVCLGQHIARIEIDAMFRQLLTRLPDLEKTGETEWQPSTFISGPKHIRVRSGRI